MFIFFASDDGTVGANKVSTNRTKQNKTEQSVHPRLTPERSVASHNRKDISIFKPTPTAVPVVTAEEAEFKNEFALFLLTTEKTVVEGEILERSTLPSPNKSDYPDCRFTVHFKGDSIISGSPIPRETSLVIEGFENYQIISNNDIQAGDKVQCTIVSFEKLPEDYQSTQQADELELFLLDVYYVVNITVINKFSSNLMTASGIPFTEGNDDYISILERHINPQISTKLQREQLECINTDLIRMNRLLDGIKNIKEINKSFAEAWKIEKAKDPPGKNRIDNYVWRNVDNSFWTLPEDYVLLHEPIKLSEATLNSFVSLKQALESNGVQLIVAIVPDMNVIAARVINEDFRNIPDVQVAMYVKQLSEVGIEAIYASDSIIEDYNRFPFSFFPPGNLHPNDNTQDIISDILAERLQRYEFHPQLDPQLFTETQSPHCYKDERTYQFPHNCDIGNNQAGTSYKCREVLYNGERIKRSKDSPVLVIGNSFIETPVSPPESLPALLSKKIGSFIDWHRISGLGPFSDIPYQLLLNPDLFLTNKQVLIMYVGAVHIGFVNRTGTMLDIAEIDYERSILNKKKMKERWTLSSNVDADKISDKELWGPLSNVDKSVHILDNSGELQFNFSIKHTTEVFSNEKPLICIISHTCVPNKNGTIFVNGIAKAMLCPNYADHSRFFNLAYELPPGTKQINLKIEGKPETIFAIRDIQIWQ